jgi:plastocyanin
MRPWLPFALLGPCAAMLLALTTAAAGAPQVQIEIKDFMFGPASVTVKAGTTVSWVNRDDEPHTIVSDSGLYRSGALDTGNEFHFTFDEPGTFHYVCTIHPRMLGTIIVEP